MKSKKKLNTKIIKELAIIVYAWEMLFTAIENAKNANKDEISDADLLAIKIHKELTKVVYAYKPILEQSAILINSVVNSIPDNSKNINNATFAFFLLDFYKQYFQNRKLDVVKKKELWDLIDILTAYFRQNDDLDRMRESINLAEQFVIGVKNY